MTDDVKIIKFPAKADSVTELLDWCREQKFTELVLFGISDKGFICHYTGGMTVTRVIGGLERAKMILHSGGEDD